ncbi:suppressor of cytokine signaling 1-like [Pelmatolapia mariae]|uniref:suppressor of cytokine signaling 1-like n=1 Tax=Pelmatolapia mariae TaxID=158779 RepID=UPI002FE666B7
MVRDNCNKVVVQSPKQSHAAEPQSSSEPSEEHREQSPNRAESRERQLDLLHWVKNNYEEDAELWEVTGADSDGLPTHLRPFTSEAEYKLVKSTYQQLLQSDYYWGSLTMEEAHGKLKNAPAGTFLIRDSGQPDVFFTLSYQSDDGPTSVRIQLNKLHFNLFGSQRTFPSLFALLTYYTSSCCKLTVPFRIHRPEGLKQMCRRAFVGVFGADRISTLPGLNKQVKSYLWAYPHPI